MKKINILLIFAFYVCQVYGQVTTTVISQSDTSLVLNYRFDSYKLNEVELNNTTYFTPEMIGTTPILNHSAPALNKVATSFRCPRNAQINIEIINESYIELENTPIAPSKGNIYRHTDPSDIPYSFGETYNRPGFYPRNSYKLRDEYSIRNVSGRTLWLYPFRYNPIDETLRAYQELTIRISFDNKLSESSNIQPAFKELLKSHFINEHSLKYDPVSEQGDMLIISHSDFIDAVQPFANWKTQLGIENEIIDIDDIGSTSGEIKAFIQEYYDQNNLTYVLLVGDHQHIPADNLNSGFSDNSYTYTSGNDNYPDLFIGRFSVESVSDVETMVERSINYEKNPVNTDAYKTAVAIGSEDGTSSTNPNSNSTGMGDDNEADWHHLMNINNDLNGFTYSNILELYEGGPYEGSLDASGNPNAFELSNQLNTGAGLINYTGHGSAESFATTGFNNTDIDQLNNTDTHPFIFSVACVNGEFMNTTCFAEKWLRATNDTGTPTGAVAVIMSTINQSWNPPMSGQDEMNDILTEQYDDNIRRSFGAITMQGCMKMNDDYGANGEEITDTWTIFGDPSLMVRTDKAGEITATYDNIIPIGSNSLLVTSNYDGGVATLTHNNQLVSQAIIENGQATLLFEPISSVSNYTITVNAFNAIPHVGSIQSIVLEGPYIISQGIVLSDSLDGADSQVEFGDSLVYSMNIENVGIESSDSLTIVVSTNLNFIDVITDTIFVNSIDQGELSLLSDQLMITVGEPDTTITDADLYFNIFDQLGNSWNATSTIIFDQPIINVDNYLIIDSLGNNNGQFDVSETVMIDFNLNNIGSAETDSVLAYIQSSNSFLICSDTLHSVESIDVNSTSTLSFECSIVESAPNSEQIAFDLVLITNQDTMIYNYTFITPICGINDIDVVVSIQPDWYASNETSYTLMSSDGQTIDEIELGSMQSWETYELAYCFSPETILDFNLYDNYGDGISSGGAYSINVCNQEILVGGEEEFSEFNYVFVVSCDQSSVILGCTDPDACNYNIDATADDNSCYELNASVSTYSYDNTTLEVNSNALQPTYQWYVDGLILDNTQSTYTPNQNGVYSIIVSDGENCSTELSFNISNLNNLDAELLSLEYFPNPNTNGMLTINVNRECDLVISDVIGRLYNEYSLHKGLQKIDISGVAPGYYHLIFDDKTTKRLIIK